MYIYKHRYTDTDTDTDIAPFCVFSQPLKYLERWAVGEKKSSYGEFQLLL